MYRFTFDKSQIPPAAAETMRLVVGYSEKGPFNNPVYIDNKQDFINLFGNGSKKLEKKGIFFHRLALQALSAGPILALNLKPFDDETVGTLTFDTSDINKDVKPSTLLVKGDETTKGLYDINRFWKIDADQLPSKLGSNSKFFSIAATDSKDASCTIFVRPCKPNTLTQYNVTIAEWYKNLNLEIPEYLESAAVESKVSDYFLEIYVFKGDLTDGAAIIGTNGSLNKYFKDGVLSTEVTNTFGEKVDALEALANDSNSNFIGLYRGTSIPYFVDQAGNYLSIDLLFNADKDIHKMIMKLDEDKFVADSVTSWDEVSEWGDTGINPAISGYYLAGYTYNVDGGITVDKSLETLKDKGLYTALTNHVDSEYHYIIDTYTTKGTSIGNKTYLTDVAKAKDNCLAIMNFPAFNDLLAADKEILSKLEAGTLSILPGEASGASYSAWYTPVIFGDGTVKNVVPSAALVSNNFMEKWNSRQPYYIVAGPNYGRLDYDGLIGPDYNYGKSDLDVLEPYGVNCIVYVPRKGTYINSNQTAKQRPVSALSKVNVRELVIYLQNEIENMLQTYQWEMNTQTLRDTIKTNADTILEKIKLNGGVYDYVNVCDDSNNTSEVIDNEMVILDTSIEPARGAGKMVQRLTIHKTGGISALTK
jgi:hypothetical protein